ncbi:MAG: LysR family transcriptional regulator [Myxococcota bacterium]
METRKLQALIAVADAGSLSGAARRMGVRVSTVSRHISDLEGWADAELVTRTGRGARLTAAGQQVVERARRVLRELDQAVVEAKQKDQTAMSRLRVSVPVEVSLSLLPEVTAGLARAFPALAVDVVASARHVAVVEEDYDAVVRLGSLRDSSLLARPVGQVQLGLYAREPPTRSLSPIDLAELKLIAVRHAPSVIEGELDGESVSVAPRSRLTVSTFYEAAQLACLLADSALLPSYTAARFRDRLHLVDPRLQLTAIPMTLLFRPRLRRDSVLDALHKLLTAALDSSRG